MNDGNTSTKHAYQAFGFVFHSELPLPGMHRAPNDKPAVVVIRCGDVPEHLDDVVARGAAFEASSNQLLLTVPNVARYLVQNGDEIVIQPEPNATESDLRAFLTSSAFGALLHQRGVLPMHASGGEV
jgi:hypothetical protein